MRVDKYDRLISLETKIQYWLTELVEVGVTVEVRCWLSVAGKWQSAVTLSWHGNRKASKSIKQYQLVLTAICNAVYTQFNTATTVTSHASFDPSLCSIHLTDIHTTLHKWRPLGGACCSLSLASSLVCTITAPLLVIYLEPHRQTKLILIDYIHRASLPCLPPSTRDIVIQKSSHGRQEAKCWNNSLITGPVLNLVITVGPKWKPYSTSLMILY